MVDGPVPLDEFKFRLQMGQSHADYDFRAFSGFRAGLFQKFEASRNIGKKIADLDGNSTKLYLFLITNLL